MCHARPVLLRVYGLNELTTKREILRARRSESTYRADTTILVAAAHRPYRRVSHHAAHPERYPQLFDNINIMKTTAIIMNNPGEHPGPMSTTFVSGGAGGGLGIGGGGGGNGGGGVSLII